MVDSVQAPRSKPDLGLSEIFKFYQSAGGSPSQQFSGVTHLNEDNWEVVLSVVQD